jgi:heme-degrading monooxygenase HmoA
VRQDGRSETDGIRLLVFGRAVFLIAVLHLTGVPGMPVLFFNRQGEKMIARMWHGRVPTSKAEEYRKFTNGRAIPDYQSVKGNLKVYVLERLDGDVTHFITLTFWESLDAIRGFAGDDLEKAKYYPEDKDFLLEFEPRVVHYEEVGHS